MIHKPHKKVTALTKMRLLFNPETVFYTQTVPILTFYEPLFDIFTHFMRDIFGFHHIS